jgi:hypothetical protein
MTNGRMVGSTDDDQWSHGHWKMSQRPLLGLYSTFSDPCICTTVLVRLDKLKVEVCGTLCKKHINSGYKESTAFIIDRLLLYRCRAYRRRVARDASRRFLR